MRLPSAFFVGVGLVMGLQAEEPSSGIGIVQSGVPVPDTGNPEPEYEIIESHTERVLREEPAPLTGMAPVKKVVNLTVDMVEDPDIGGSARIIPPTLPGDATATPEPGPDGEAPTELISLSATVYDNSCTRLSWTVPGDPSRELVAWSNIDFNTFTNVTQFAVGGRAYYLCMGLGNESTDPDLPADGNPGIPLLPPDATPSFVLTQGDGTDAGATAPITALHEYFLTDGARLHAEHEAREAARLEREAWLRAHPPEPRDVHIRFWQRSEQATRPEPTPPDAAIQGSES